MITFQNKRISWLFPAFCLIGFTTVISWVMLQFDRAHLPTASINSDKKPTEMVFINTGHFRRGNDLAYQRDVRPAHDVALRPFWIDKHPVTNRQFAKFVAATKYITTAEQLGWGNVFDETNKQWKQVKGANWREPFGPNFGSLAHETLPVVQVSWHDAVAYTHWLKKRLPTEAEWECVARSGMTDREFPWGNRELKNGKHQANYWQGPFSASDSVPVTDRVPVTDFGEDGFTRLAPIKSFPANAYGVYAMAGNLWQWCGDWYAADYYQLQETDNPTGPRSGSHRVIRGGSWLDPSETLKVYRREHRPPDASYCNVGFRCVKDVKRSD